MIVKDMISDKERIIKCEDYTELFKIFLDREYSKYAKEGDSDEDLTLNLLIYGVNKYINDLVYFFRGNQLLFTGNDIIKLLKESSESMKGALEY